MKKKKLPPHQEHIQRLVDRFLRVMFLHEYSYVTVWEMKKGKEYKNALACITVDNRYLTFVLHFDDKAVKRAYDEGMSFKLANMVMHELAHVHTDVLYKLVAKHEPKVEELIQEIWERQTQRLAVVALGQLPRRIWEIRK